MKWFERIRYSYSFLGQFADYRSWQKRWNIGKLAKQDRRNITGFYARPSSLPAPDKTVLFASFLPLPYVLKIEGVLSRILQSRGWKGVCLHFPGDMLVSRYHKEIFGNHTIHVNPFIPWNKLDQIEKLVDGALSDGYDAVKAFKYSGSLVGTSALSSLSGLDPTGIVRFDDENRIRLKKLLIRGCLYTEACKNILQQFKPQLVLAVEKGFVGCSEIFHQSLHHENDYIQWMGCHEPNSIMMKRYNMNNLRSHPFSISSKSWNRIVNKPWNGGYQSTVMREFEEGYSGNKWFQYKKLTDHTKILGRDEIIQKYNLDKAKKIAVIFSPILNDANLFYGEDLFKGGFREWLIETVKEAVKNDHVNWILKLHPANTYRRSNIGYTGDYGEILAIKEALGSVPDRIRIMHPADEVNPLAMFRCLDYALTVRGTVGAEIPCFGKPVLTGGSGRYSGFGFTEDSSTTDEYLQKIRNIHLLPPLSEDKAQLAMKHAYLFFKVRPAKYDTFAQDMYGYPQGHPFNRNLSFKCNHFSELSDNPQIQAMTEWMLHSTDQDFLTPGYL
jgi:hypothetical protein